MSECKGDSSSRLCSSADNNPLESSHTLFEVFGCSDDSPSMGGGAVLQCTSKTRDLLFFGREDGSLGGLCDVEGQRGGIGGGSSMLQLEVELMVEFINDV